MLRGDMMEYTWNLAEDTGGGGNADATDRSSIMNGQRLIIDARRLQHQTEGLFHYSPWLFSCQLHCAEDIVHRTRKFVAQYAATCFGYRS